MVDNILGSDSNSILDNSNILNLKNQNVKDVNVAAASSEASVSALKDLGLQDGAFISPEAMERFAQEREALRFSRMAQRINVDSDPDRVSTLKDMVNSGRINEYLRSINTEDLAQKILDGPFGHYLQ